jgi:peptidoglycan/xylan/chitin deacetylase (PgdA/CDA1 family)
VPRAWLDKLATVQVPNIPVSTDPSHSGRPSYAGHQNDDKAICSFTYQCVDDEDLYAPEAGHMAVTFDDGPSGGSEELEKYLRSQGAMGIATHFIIGSYVTYGYV